MAGKNLIRNFNEEYKIEDLVNKRDLGLQVVEVEKIIGSVGRYIDFDRKFRPRTRQNQARFNRIEQALLRGEILPPVVLYKIGDEYFVVDGNHRVSAAKKIGQIYIDAYVTEYLLCDDTIESIVSREKSDFGMKTGLTNIYLTELGEYQKLLNQITEHKYYLSEHNGYEVDLKIAAIDWYTTIFVPIIEKIEKEEIADLFPGRTVHDLYIYIADHKWMKSKRIGYDIGFNEAIRDFEPPSKEKKFVAEIRHIFEPLLETRKWIRHKFEEILEMIPMITEGKEEQQADDELDEK